MWEFEGLWLKFLEVIVYNCECIDCCDLKYILRFFFIFVMGKYWVGKIVFYVIVWKFF